MSEKLERPLDEVASDLSQEPESTESNKPKKVKKVAKKEVKKAAKKVAKKSTKQTESTEGKVTLAELASEAKITTASARRKLRDAELNREGRWAWDEGSK